MKHPVRLDSVYCYGQYNFKDSDCNTCGIKHMCKENREMTKFIIKVMFIRRISRKLKKKIKIAREEYRRGLYVSLAEIKKTYRIR